MKFNHFSWELRVQPLSVKPPSAVWWLLLRGKAKTPSPFLCLEMPQWGKVIPLPHLRPILATLGMGNTHTFCPAAIKEAKDDQRHGRHVGAQCTFLSVHVITHVDVKFAVPALAAPPAPDIQVTSTKTALRGPGPRVMAAPEAGAQE